MRRRIPGEAGQVALDLSSKGQNRILVQQLTYLPKNQPVNPNTPIVFVIILVGTILAAAASSPGNWESIILCTLLILVILAVGALIIISNLVTL